MNLDRNAAYQLEKKLISSYHSHITENGYNASTGGASGAQGTVRSEEWKRALSDRVSGEKHPLYGKHHSPETRRKIGLSHLGKPNLIARNPKHHEKQMRAVICYETGEVFCSQSEAARKHHVPSPNICVACQLFPHRTSAGYHWMYADDSTAQSVINLPDNPKAPKPVMCLNTSRVYVSIGEAAKATGCDKRHISRCCRGLRKSTKGLRWCYAIQERNDTD